MMHTIYVFDFRTGIFLLIHSFNCYIDTKRLLIFCWFFPSFLWVFVVLFSPSNYKITVFFSLLVEKSIPHTHRDTAYELRFFFQILSIHPMKYIFFWSITNQFYPIARTFSDWACIFFWKLILSLVHKKEIPIIYIALYSR